MDNGRSGSKRAKFYRNKLPAIGATTAAEAKLRSLPEGSLTKKHESSPWLINLRDARIRRCQYVLLVFDGFLDSCQGTSLGSNMDPTDIPGVVGGPHGLAARKTQARTDSRASAAVTNLCST